MKILNAAEIRLWDQYTIQHEPIVSVDLMERAAETCVEWIEQNVQAGKRFSIFCGKGNNGGDGLAIARLLTQKSYPVAVHILEFGHKGTEDFQINLARLHQYPEATIRFIQTEENFHDITPDEIIIDALYGSGLNRKLEGVTARLVDHINASACKKIAIDIPSGMFVDKSSYENTIIKADHTLSFQCLKQAFLVAENAGFTGQVHVLDIALHPDFYSSINGSYQLTDRSIVQSIYRPRNPFAHKGNFGHAMLVAGSYGKIGAAILSARSCLRSGVGLLSCHIPKCGYNIMQSAVPEAMVTTDFNSSFVTKTEEDPRKFKSIGIGPGIGTASETKIWLREILNVYQDPVVLDADALNIIASQHELLRLIPKNSIITPHPKEFGRLFGESDNDFDRITLAIQKARALNIIIVLKGHYSLIATPDAQQFFNPTGNAGMATGGSGDVLTGILTGLLAQGYSAEESAILGTYLHGFAGDLAAKKLSMEAMVAGDIIENLPEAYLSMQSS